MATDTKSPGEKLSVSPKTTLTLKPRAETGVVRQSFSHGRSKAVVVEKVRKRTIGPGEAKAAEAAPAAAAPERATPRRVGVVARGATPAAAPAAAAPATPAVAPKPSGVVLRTLTDEERNRRAHALGDAKVREAEERKIAEEEAKIRQQRETIDRTEREAAEARKRTEEDRRRHDEETKRKADEVAKKRFGGEEEARLKSAGAPGSRKFTPEAEDDDRRPARRGAGAATARPAAAPKAPRAGAPKQRGRLTLVTALSADEDARAFGRVVPPPHAAHDRPSRHREQGKAAARSHRPGNDDDPGTREPHVGARCRCHQDPDETGSHGQDHRHDRCRHRAASRRRARPHGAARRRVRRRGRPVRCRRRCRHARAASAGRDHHGPCRSRQDLAARRDPANQRGERRSRRHYPAHRRLSGEFRPRAARSPSSTHPATRHSPRCARAARR